MAKKTEEAAEAVPFAARDVAIDGQHFARGEEVTGVDDEELAKAIRLGAVVIAQPDEADPDADAGGAAGNAA